MAAVPSASISHQNAITCSPSRSIRTKPSSRVMAGTPIGPAGGTPGGTGRTPRSGRRGVATSGGC